MAKIRLDDSGRGRDERGRFVSRSRSEQEILKQLAKHEKHAKAITDATAKTRKQHQSILDMVKKTVGLESRSGKTVSKQVQQLRKRNKHLREGMRTVKHESRIARKAHREAMRGLRDKLRETKRLNREKIKGIRAERSSGRPGRGLPGIGVPSFIAGGLSVVALTAAITRLSSFVQDLGRSRGLTSALFGSGRNVVTTLGLGQRDQAFLQLIAEKTPAIRLLDDKQIKALMRLREGLRRQLGSDQGDKLANQLVGSIENFRQLQEFADKASVSIDDALSRFVHFDPSSFTLALNSMRQPMDDINQTADVLEKAWIDIKNSFEDFAVSILQTHGGDIRNVVSSIAGAVDENVRAFGAWFNDLQGQFAWLIKTIQVTNSALNTLSNSKSTVVGFDASVQLEGIAGAIRRNERHIAEAEKRGDQAAIDRAKARIEVLLKKRATFESRLRDAVGEPDHPAIQLPSLSKFLEQYSNKSSDAAKAQKNLNEQAEKLNKTLQNQKQIVKGNEALLASETRKELQQLSDLESARTALEESRLAVIQSSPLGFGQSLQQTSKLVSQLDRQRDALQKRLTAINAIENKSLDQRREALQIEAEINQVLVKRNLLLSNINRGYLDVIQSQAFGAGRFSKIIIDQDQAMGRALGEGMAKQNPLLGFRGVGLLHPFRLSGNLGRDAQDLRQRAAAMRAMFPNFFAGMNAPALPPNVGGLAVDAALRGGRGGVIAAPAPAPIRPSGRTIDGPSWGARMRRIGEALSEFGDTLDDVQRRGGISYGNHRGSGAHDSPPA